MKTEKQHLGSWGEELVEAYYVRQGFILLEKNFRYKRIELDLLFEKGHSLYSVEVKTRTTLFYGNPEESITSAKRKRLYRASVAFASIQSKKYKAIIVQVCALIVSKDKVNLRIYTLD